MRPEFRHKSVITSNATQNRRYGKNPERARTFTDHDTRTLIRGNPGTSAGFFFYDVLPPPLEERKHARVPRGTILRASRGHVPRQARRDSQGRKEPRAAASRSVPEFYFRMTARIARISTDHTTEALIRVCSVQKPWRSFSYIAMPCSM